MTPLESIGQRFGKLTVLRLVAGVNPKRLSRIALWKTPMWCRCDCGRETAVYFSALTNGNSRSCGCQMSGGAHARDQQLETRTKQLAERVDRFIQ